MQYFKNLCFIIVASLSINAQVIWDGPTVTFDNTPETPIDIITATVNITRGNSGGMYNAVSETSATSTSPLGTEWSEGHTDNLNNLSFGLFTETVGTGNNGFKPPLNTPLVVHLIDDDIYINITFSAWGGGGLMTYERSSASEVNETVLLNMTENGALNMAENSSVNIGGLKLTTSSAYSISGSNSVAVVDGALSNNGNTSIPKYYKTTSEISGFSGVITFNYSDDDVADFDEELLVLEAVNSEGLWTTLDPSTVSTNSNEISHNATELSFLKITLVSSDSSLSIENPLTSESSVLVYPNPTLNTIYIKGTTIDFKAELFNVSGQKILESSNNRLDVSHLEQGMYILKIKESNSSESSFKIIKN